MLPIDKMFPLNPASKLHLKTLRLDLIPCSLSVAQAAVSDKSQVEKLLGVQVPDDWHTCEGQDFLPQYAQMLINDPSQLGWGVWLMIHTAEQTLIGDLGFGGKPHQEGSVEIGYEVLPKYRNQGYAFEGAKALVDWASNQPNLKRIVAYSPYDNVASIRILEKLGMQQIEKYKNFFKWELKI